MTRLENLKLLSIGAVLVAGLATVASTGLSLPPRDPAGVVDTLTTSVGALVQDTTCTLSGVVVNPGLVNNGTIVGAGGCCHETLVSAPGGSTEWTYLDTTAAVWGLNLPSVSAGPNGGWTGVPAGATPIWKEAGGSVPGTNPGNAIWGVEFVRGFVTCMSIPEVTTLTVATDNANLVYVNNQLVGSCGSFFAANPGPDNCFSTAQQYTVTLLPYPQANTIRIHVQNEGTTTPAMASYSLPL